MDCRLVPLAFVLIVAWVPGASAQDACTAPMPDALYEPSPDSWLGSMVRTADQARTTICDGDDAREVAITAAKSVVHDTHSATGALVESAVDAVEWTVAAIEPASLEVGNSTATWCTFAAHRLLGVPAQVCPA